MAELIFALDVDDLEEARRFVEGIPELKFYKVGLQLYTREGMRIIEYLKENDKKIFLDLKFHDIPNTVAMASRQVVRMGVDVFNIHTTGGREMMKRAAEAVRDEGEKLGLNPLLIGVTILTSLDDEDLREIGFSYSPQEGVLHLSKLAYESGLDGVVCSPLEAGRIKEVTSRSFYTFTPGITITGGRRDDQKRTMGVREAVDNGSDFLIIGRPIRKSDNPRETVVSILQMING